jgi:hypothetical protein
VQPSWPEFADGFLRTVLSGIARRRKTLGHRGDVRLWFPDADDRREWCALSLELSIRRAVMLSLWPRNHASLRVVSTWVRDRGRVLFDLPDLRLPADAARIVAAFEVTTHLVAVGREPDTFGGPASEVWRGMQLRVVA